MDDGRLQRARACLDRNRRPGGAPVSHWVRWWKPETSYPRNGGWTRWHMAGQLPGTSSGPLACLPADRTVPQDAEHHDGQPPADQCCKRCLARAARARTP